MSCKIDCLPYKTKNLIKETHGGGRVVSAPGSETSVSSSIPTSAIIYDAYISIMKNKKNLIKETRDSFLFVECGEEQQVTRPRGEDKTSIARFPVKLQKLFTDCVKCKSEMIRLPCCKHFNQN